MKKPAPSFPKVELDTVLMDRKAKKAFAMLSSNLKSSDEL
jgi:hypothetical protein